MSPARAAHVMERELLRQIHAGARISARVAWSLNLFEMGTIHTEAHERLEALQKLIEDHQRAIDNMVRAAVTVLREHDRQVEELWSPDEIAKAKAQP